MSAQTAWRCPQGIQQLLSPETVTSALLRLVEDDADLIRIHARLLRLELDADVTHDQSRAGVRLALIAEWFRELGRVLARAEGCARDITTLMEDPDA